MNESIQKWLERNRPPRVKITYDVETGGAIEQRELPFVVGIFADLSGDRSGNPPLPDFALRSMQSIDRDSFNDVMAQAQVAVNLGTVKRTLPKEAPDDPDTLDSSISFRSLDDFAPVAIVRAVAPLNDLYRLRGNIRMLQNKLESSANFAKALEPLMQPGNQAARTPLQVLAATTRSGTPDAQKAALTAAQQKLRAFAATFATAADDTARNTAATNFGFPTSAAVWKPDMARQFVGLFCATDTPENRRAAQDQLTALVSFSQNISKVDPATQKKRLDVVKNLGLPADERHTTDIAAEATSILAVLTATQPPAPTPAQIAARADAQRVALLYLGLQEPEDSALVQSPDPVTAAQLSAVQLAEQQHVADSRWFANNMLLAAVPPPSAQALADAQGAQAAAAAASAEAMKKDGATQADGDTAGQAASNSYLAKVKTDAATAVTTAAKTAATTASAEAMKKDGATQADGDTAGQAASDAVTAQAAAAAAAPAAAAAAALGNALVVLNLLAATGPKTDDDRQRFVAPLGYFVTDILAQLDAPGAQARKPVMATLAIDQRVAAIDDMLSVQLRAIMHAPHFQALEATWRGMFYLVSRAETGKMLKLFVFNATKQELLNDMDRAVDKDQSHLFKMIYEAGYGTLGGQPYSLLLGGYEVGRSAQDIEFLSKIAEIAAASHAPFITAASSSIFGLDRFGDLARPRDLEKIFEGVELVGFQSFRETEDSRYVTLVLPHVLLRLPYGAKSWPVEGLSFEERVHEDDPSEFLWGNAAYLLTERITNAFSLYAWTAAIRGVEGGGLIEGLPLYTYPIYPTNSDAQQLFCPTEVSITDRREKELSDLGFIALCHCLGTGTAAFFGGQTANQPKAYLTDDATANAKLSALLPYMLAASRFAHYIKVIMRDKIGSFLTRGNVEAFLNTWIAQYVLLDENAPQDAKASYPLSQANVIVTDVPGEPGSYNAVVFLRPHFQLEELTTSIRLVANLPAA